MKEEEKKEEKQVAINDFATPLEEERQKIDEALLEMRRGPVVHSRFIAPRDGEWKKVQKKAKKVCIVGAGPTWRVTPWGDPTYEFWGINAFHRMKDPENYDRWFQIHLPGSGEGHIDDKDHKVFLEKRKWPIYMVRKFPEYPGSLAFPFWEVVDRCCPQHRPYFTNTIDFLVCMAIMEGFEEIALFGVDFISDIDDEYYKMRQSLEYYLGRADEAGIRLNIPPDSALLKTDRVYGFEPRRRDTAAIIERLRGLADKMKADEVQAFEKYNDQKAVFHRMQGACSIIDRISFMLRMRDRGLPF
jgi:hypothetical protein